jgi:tRNA (guanine37-N1)-methyltransferase
MQIDLLSLFPEYFDSPLQTSILKRAQQNELIKVRRIDIREFAEGKHKKVDERPAGGGPGMVMMPEPIVKAIRSVKTSSSMTVYLSPQGRPLTPELCKQLAVKEHLILLCGHYEGVDQRALDLEVDEEVSIGDYVLTNGCLAALVLLDAMVRYIPGVLGNEQAAASDSFEQGVFEGPQYTKPNEFEGLPIPEVLLSGNHEKIEAWKKEQSLRKMQQYRQDLLER